MIMLCVLLPGTLYAEIKDAPRPSEYDAPAILDFTRHLISRKEYFRAYTELKRLGSFYPEYIPRGRFHVTRLYLLYRGNQFSDLLEITPPADPGHTQCIDALFKADVLIERTYYQKAENILAVCDGASDRQLLFMSFKRRILDALLQNNYPEAGDLVTKAEKDFSDDIASGKYRELVKYAENGHGKEKHPLLGAACGAVPGMGYIYAGNTPTGVIALIAVSALGGLAYLSYTTRNKPLAVFFGIGTAFFYTGGMIGGYRETVSYNERLKGGIKETLMERMEIDADRDILFRRYGIMNGNSR